jgi:hypothetical protein
MILLSLIAIVGLGGFLFYKYYLPEMVAEAIVSEELPAYVPDRVKAKIEHYKAPINQVSSDVIREIHQSDVSIDLILKAVDDTQEADVYAALHEVNERKPETTDEVFNVAKKHIQADFDVELLRSSFNKNVNMKMVNKAIKNLNAKIDEDVDPEMMKAIIKQVLIEKEKEYNARSGN